MKSVGIVSFGICLLFLAACIKPKEPIVKICPEEPLVITTSDTLVLENCSENSSSQRWDLPSGAFSTQNMIAVASGLPTTYKLKLSVSNNEYANEFTKTRTVKIISDNFTTSEITLNPPSNTQNITACTIVNDLDAADPDGGYSTAGPPDGYILKETLPNGCFVYKPDPQNLPSGTAVTYHYFCISNEHCDTTKIIIKNP
jgi:hypothetical protein